ncbi:MAG: hypothetical protein HC767_15685 [Akkermansiaceae bacterium]|nr:hypothetical protein [Akkermansiaceae bacterium]
MLARGALEAVIDAAALSEAYDTPVSVLRHPDTDPVLVVDDRLAQACLNRLAG